MFDALVNITEFLWGTPLMILMVGVGLYLSARTGFFQITGFGTVCKKTLGEVDVYKRQLIQTTVMPLPRALLMKRRR